MDVSGVIVVALIVITLALLVFAEMKSRRNTRAAEKPKEVTKQ